MRTTTVLDQHWFTTKEAADYIRVSPGALKMMRFRGNGPEFVSNGGRIIRYSREALDAFLKGAAA